MAQQPEARIIINRDPSDSAKVPAKLMRDAAANNEAIADEVRKRRKEIHKQAKIDLAGEGLGPQEEPVPAPEREDIDSIEIPLRDGRVLEYGPPAGISLSDRIARLYSTRSLAEGGADPGVTEYRLTRLLMGVRSINGKFVPPITNLVERTRMANQLGDEAIDLLNLFDTRYWPPLRTSELPAIKKNLRQP